MIISPWEVAILVTFRTSATNVWIISKVMTSFPTRAPSWWAHRCKSSLPKTLRRWRNGRFALYFLSPFLLLAEVFNLASGSFATFTFSFECQCISWPDHIVATLNCPWHFVNKTTVFFSYQFLLCLSAVYTYPAISASFPCSSLHMLYSFTQAALSLALSRVIQQCIVSNAAAQVEERLLHQGVCTCHQGCWAAAVLTTDICSPRLRKMWSGGEVTALMSSPLYCTIAGCTQLAYLATTFWRLFFILFLSTCTSTSLYNQCYWFCIRYSGVWLWF